VTLARLVSNVTETLAGTTFSATVDRDRGHSICGRMVILPIPGARDISVVLCCDSAGGRALAAALRGCPLSQVTRTMIKDGIAELLNMVAGQIQSELQIDQQLGLPRTTSLAELSENGGFSFHDSILLTSDSLGDLKLWVFELVTPTDDGQPRALFKNGVRSLIRKLLPAG
jgi:hypothetical protein